MNNETLKRIYNDYAKNAAILEQPVLSFNDWIMLGIKKLNPIYTQLNSSQYIKAI